MLLLTQEACRAAPFCSHERRWLFSLFFAGNLQPNAGTTSPGCQRACLKLVPPSEQNKYIDLDKGSILSLVVAKNRPLANARLTRVQRHANQAEMKVSYRTLKRSPAIGVWLDRFCPFTVCSERLKPTGRRSREPHDGLLGLNPRRCSTFPTNRGLSNSGGDEDDDADGEIPPL